MKISITILIGIFSFLGFYSENDEGLNAEPDWVVEIMDKKPKMTKITKCIWNDEYVFKVNSCTTCHDMQTKVYNWNKEVICRYGGVLKQDTCEEEGMLFQNCEVIYNPKRKFTIGIGIE